MKSKKDIVAEYFLLAVGAFIMSVGVESVFNEEQIVSGGVTGLGIIIEALSFGKVPVWITNLACNIPLFIAGVKVLDRTSMKRTVYTTILSTIFMATLPVFPILTDDTLVNMLLGGMLYGISYGILFRYKASSGGADLLALIVGRFRRDISTPVILAVIDITIVLAGAVVFGVENILYAIVVIFISTKVADRIIQGLRQGKMIYLISERSGEIKDYIINNIHRGVTILNAKGGYKNKDRVMIISVLSSRQLVELKDKIREIDDKSFLIICQITDVFGEGFTKITQ